MILKQQQSSNFVTYKWAGLANGEDCLPSPFFHLLFFKSDFCHAQQIQVLPSGVKGHLKQASMFMLLQRFSRVLIEIKNGLMVVIELIIIGNVLS